MNKKELTAWERNSKIKELEEEVEYWKREAKFQEEFNEKHQPKIFKDYSILFDKDRNIAERLNEFVTHLAKTCSDKYTCKLVPIDTKDILYSKEYGEGACLIGVQKYLQRYLAAPHLVPTKKKNQEDLHKAMHYILFLLQRDMWELLNNT